MPPPRPVSDNNRKLASSCKASGLIAVANFLIGATNRHFTKGGFAGQKGTRGFQNVTPFFPLKSLYTVIEDGEPERSDSCSIPTMTYNIFCVRVVGDA